MPKKQIIQEGLPVKAPVEDVAIAGEKPNILLICMDQLRADFLSINGHPLCQTPHLDQLALSGTNFRHAMSETPVCCPARRTLMTGLDRYGIDMNYNRDLQPFPQGPKLAEALSQAGYQTHGVGKMHTWPPRDRMGFGDIEVNEEGRTAGHDYPDDYQQFLQESGLGPQAHAHGMGNNQYGYRPSSLPEPATTTGWTADRAMRFLRRRDPTRPFFLYVSFDKPHPPLTPPSEFYELYRDKTFPDPVRGDWVDNKPLPRRESMKLSQNWDQYTGRPDVIQESLKAYAATITHIDSRIGQLLGTLRETSVMDNTWIMVVADHGDHCFDHELTAKGDFFTGSTNIPYFLIPASTALGDLGRECISKTDREHAVGLQDVMPTLLELAGAPLPPTMNGCSLLPLMRDGGSIDREILCGNIGVSYGAQDGRYKYQWMGDTDTEFLFDQLQDPKDERDLSDSPDHQLIKAKLREGLRQWIFDHGDDHATQDDLATVPLERRTEGIGHRASSWNNRGWRG